MNPRVVRNHCRAAALLLIAALALGGSHLVWVVFVLTVAALANLIPLNASYARALASPPARVLPNPGPMRTAGRAAGDRIVGLSSLAALLLPLVGSAALLLFHADGFGLLAKAHIPDVFVAIILFAWLTIPVSSLWDWYYVRPRRDGTVRVPPCLDSDADRRRLLTRVWLWHRSVPVVGFALGAIAVLVLAFVGLAAILPKDSYTTALLETVALPLSLVTVALLPWIRGFITFVPMLGSTLSARLGDPVSATVDRQDRTGIVFSVALDHGFVVVGDDGGVFKVPLSDPSIRVLNDFPFPPVRHCSTAICQGYDEKSECAFALKRRRADGTLVDKDVPTVRTPRFYVF
jgi:hypothetical protein